jgi:hypothetical protein
MRARRPAETFASSPRLLAAGISLHVDLVTAEVVTALHEAGVDSILLRGPAIARWLYDDATSRSYIDADLLVRYSEVARAEEVLSELGFADATVEGLLAADRPTHAHTWVRTRDGAAVDLHYTLLGVRLPRARTWEIFGAGTETISVGGAAVEILRPPGRAVVVALHAAQHGIQVGKPLDDLARALELISEDVWAAAAALADRLEATTAFAAGLRLLPSGAELAGRLGLPTDRSTETALRAETAPPMALGFEWLARTPGTWAKARLVARKIVPDAAFMRAWSPLARRGRAGLAAAYAWRALWLAQHAAPGLLAWLRARRAAR